MRPLRSPGPAGCPPVPAPAWDRDSGTRSRHAMAWGDSLPLQSIADGLIPQIPLLTLFAPSLRIAPEGGKRGIGFPTAQTYFKLKMANVLHGYKELEIVHEYRWGEAGRQLGIVTISYNEKPGIQALATTAPDRPPVVGTHPSHLRDYEYVRL